jgi:peroxiredoxin
MYKKLNYLITVLLVSGSVSYAQEVKFTGTADKKFDGNKIILYNRATGDHDSAFIKDGKFAISVAFKEPTLYLFYSDLELKTKGGYSPYGILVTEPGTVKIDASPESFSASKVSGAKENALYKSFSEKSNKAQQKIIDDLTVKYGKELINNRNPDTSDTKFKQLMQDYQQMSEANQKIEEERLTQFVKANPGSFAAVYLLNGYVNRMELKKVEGLYASLSPKYKQTRSGKSIFKGIEARKITAIGKIAPDFTQPDTLGNAVTLSSLRGQYVLVDFWASWCGPCRAENPNLVKTFNRYKDKGFTVLGVSLDQPGKKDAWLAAIHKDNLTWTQVSDLKFWDNEVAVLYGVKAIPTNLLLDKDGKIIAKDLRGEELNKKLSELFGG